ncbi:CAAX amino terminal protease [Olea europaea subsp. europaea]|uniref:CAAX amino terminal protease n=1 Tax=Olea europaea subsp. europaea TaxID=158383 RepID=A0A8S0U5X5_OLEEU|nr:CAAX amino terminal protease [Olea europaea subsp. europaea]
MKEKKITYMVHDFSIDMQIWAYEALLEVGERFALRGSDSGDGGHAAKEDSDEEAFEGRSGTEQTFGDDEENERSGSDRDDEDTEDTDVAHIAPCQDDVNLPVAPMEDKLIHSLASWMSTIHEPQSPQMQPKTMMKRQRVAMRRMATALLLKSQLSGRYLKHELEFLQHDDAGHDCDDQLLLPGLCIQGEGEENQKTSSDVGRIGTEGGILKLVGKVALLWDGMRGTMSLTDKLISFLCIAEHLLILRILDFVFMVLLLWSLVVIPLLPSLIQSWATRSPFKIAVLACIASVYVSIMIMITLWENRICKYDDPLKQYGMDLTSIHEVAEMGARSNEGR